MDRKRNVLRRSVSLLLCTLLLAGLLLPALAAETDETEAAPYADMLEAMLNGDRHWVLDTLVDGSLKTNLYAKSGYYETDRTMMEAALEAYESADSSARGKVYKAMVDILVAPENTETIVESFYNVADGIWDSAIGELFGSDDEFRAYAKDVKESLVATKYEPILKPALTADYTTSAGTTLLEQDESYADLGRLKQAMKATKSMTDYLTSALNLGTAGFEAANVEEYFEKFAGPYYNAVKSYFSDVGQLQKNPNRLNTKILQSSFSWLATFAMKEIYDGSGLMPETFPQTVALTFTEYGIQDMLKKAGKQISFASSSIDNYIYLNMLQQQRDSLAGPLARLTANENGSALGHAAETFTGMLDKAAQEQIGAYDAILETVRENRMVSRYATQQLKSISKKLVKVSGTTSLSAITSAITKVADLAVWGAEQAIGLKTTAQLTYQLLYLKDIIEGMQRVYQKDLAAYQAAPSDELAKNVLDDLLLLQKLRLRGETLAYNMASAQASSWLGLIFLGEDALDVWNTRYQHHVDAFVGASLTPTLSGPLTVGANQTLQLCYSQEKGWYGALQTKISDSETRWADVLELFPKLLYGVQVNGGTLILGDLFGQELYVPGISAAAGSKIQISGPVHLTELYQTGSATLEFYKNGSLTVDSMLHLENVSFKTEGATAVQCTDAELTGTIGIPELCMSGDGTFTDCTLPSLTLAGTDDQQLTGTLNVQDLTFENTAGRVAVNAAVSVSGTLQNQNTALRSGQKVKLLAGGRIDGSVYHGALTLDGVSIPQSIRFDGDLYTTENECTFSSALRVNGSLRVGGPVRYDKDVTVQGSYQTTASGLTQTFASGASLTVGQDVNLQKATLSGLRTMRCGGDWTAPELTAENLSLTLDGTVPQTICTETVLEDLLIENTGKTGVSIQKPVTVSGTLRNRSTHLTGGENLTLLSTGTLDGDSFCGSLRVQDYEFKADTAITGDLYADGSLAVASGTVTASGGFRHTDAASLTVAQDAALHVAGITTVQNTALQLDGTLQTGGDCLFTATTLSGDGTFRASADLQLDGESACGTLELTGSTPQRVSGSPLRVRRLLLNNTSKKGVTLASAVTVTESYESNGGGWTQKGGQLNLSASQLTGDVTLFGDVHLTEATALKGQTVTVDGTLWLDSAALTLEDATLEVTDSIRTSGTGNALTIDAGSAVRTGNLVRLSDAALQLDGALTSGSDCLLTATTLSGGGTLRACGDLTLGGESACGTLELCGKLPQTVSGSALEVRKLILNNTSRQGVTLSSAVTVTETYESNGGPCTQAGGKLNLDLSKLNEASTLLGDVHLTEPTTLKDRTVTVDGSLWLDGAALTLENATLIVRGSLRSTGTDCALTIGADSAVQVRNLVQLSDTTLSADGALTIGGDCVLTGGSLTGAGQIAFGGDLYSGTAAVSLTGAARFDGRLAQRVSGSSLQFASLTFSNPSRSGVWLLSTINYSGTLTTGQTRINNAERLVQK